MKKKENLKSLANPKNWLFDYLTGRMTPDCSFPDCNDPGRYGDNASDEVRVLRTDGGRVMPHKGID